MKLGGIRLNIYKTLKKAPKKGAEQAKQDGLFLGSLLVQHGSPAEQVQVNWDTRTTENLRLKHGRSAEDYPFAGHLKLERTEPARSKKRIHQLRLPAFLGPESSAK